MLLFHFVLLLSILIVHGDALLFCAIRSWLHVIYNAVREMRLFPVMICYVAIIIDDGGCFKTVSSASAVVNAVFSVESRMHSLIRIRLRVLGICNAVVCMCVFVSGACGFLCA